MASNPLNPGTQRPVTNVLVATTAMLRRYNPGLFTSVVLFLPWGVFLLVYISGTIQHSVLFNVVGILAGIAGHAVIMTYALRRREAPGV